MRFVLISMVVICLTGCSSIRTNAWTRAEDENLHPDGCTNLKGVPVMLKVPSHLEVTITETLYLQYDRGNRQLVKIPLQHPDLDVSASLKYTEKMFLVDPVRVGAGDGSFGFAFGPKDAASVASGITGEDGTNAGHGYIHGTNFKANDQTILQGANLLSTVLRFRPKLAGSTAGIIDTSTGKEIDQAIIKMKRTVAYQRFDLASPGVDDEVWYFMEQHMNCCHEQCPGQCPAEIVAP